MARTDVDQVNHIMETSLTDNQIRPIIEQANRIVTSKIGGEGLTDELLKDIETWMTAHLIALGKERQPLEERVGDIWLKFNENPAGFFNATTYGQTCLMLDTSGKLQAASMKKISFTAIQQINVN